MKSETLILNALTTRQRLLDKLLGQGERDIDTECGYAKVITDEMFRAMYDREMGARVVNVYPEETWKKLPIIYEDPDPKISTPFEAGLEALNKAHSLLHYLQRADELSGIGQYGAILWGIDDGKALNTPVDGSDQWEESTGTPRPGKTTPDRKIIFIRIFDASLIRIATYETDATKPRFGKPLTYTIQVQDPRNQEHGATATAPNLTETTVHWSRISHIADNCKTSEVLGTPRMQPVWNRLYDLRKILGGSGEMYWKGGFPGLSLETQPGLENAEIDQEKTREMMADYMNGMQRYLALTGMSAKSLSPQIADPSSTFEVQIKAICVTLGVPYRVFMGIEEGVVSGDQATRAWVGRLENRQTRYVTPMLLNPVIQRLIDIGVLPDTKEPRGWTVEWPDLSTPSEGDRADVAGKQTEALAKYVSGGVDTLIPPMQYLTLVLGFDDDTAESILGAAVEHLEDVKNEETETPGRLHPPPPPVDPNAAPAPSKK